MGRTPVSQGFVLLPGAGLSAWLWTELVPLLAAPAAAARRLEDESPEGRARASFTDLVSYATKQIDETGWDRVVLVGHSGAGLIDAIGCTYVVCDQDQTLSVEQQEVQAAHLGITDLRAIPGDHLPMLSCPGLLAGVLNSVLVPPVSEAR